MPALLIKAKPLQSSSNSESCGIKAFFMQKTKVSGIYVELSVKAGDKGMFSVTAKAILRERLWFRG